MEWIVIGLIIVSSSVVVCLGGVYYRLFWSFPTPDFSPKRPLLPAPEPEVVFESVYTNKDLKPHTSAV